MTAYLNINYPMSGQLSSQHLPSGVKGTTLSPSFMNDQALIYRDDANSICDFRSSNTEISSVASSPSSSNDQFSKMDIRRLKNRESAARSRQKIKDKLAYLEKSKVRLEERNDSLINEKFLLMNEIESLENKVISISLENSIQMKGSLSPVSDSDSGCEKESDILEI
ncbi:hypothetical protein RDWZM_002876 [Blomia tropicalis]|uniref:BZIP domain-containing protein n=1 Tax=Blomia tropicalis TaxID=40697 RepID=A0A9Q0RS10_BLOTA|nr:hypothetical protein RDWZM_002876 [Blomia tropicalis]